MQNTLFQIKKRRAARRKSGNRGTCRKSPFRRIWGFSFLCLGVAAEWRLFMNNKNFYVGMGMGMMAAVTLAMMMRPKKKRCLKSSMG